MTTRKEIKKVLWVRMNMGTHTDTMANRHMLKADDCQKRRMDTRTPSRIPTRKVNAESMTNRKMKRSKREKEKKGHVTSQCTSRNLDERSFY